MVSWLLPPNVVKSYLAGTLKQIVEIDPNDVSLSRSRINLEKPKVKKDLFAYLFGFEGIQVKESSKVGKILINIPSLNGLLHRTGNIRVEIHDVELHAEPVDANDLSFPKDKVLENRRGAVDMRVQQMKDLHTARLKDEKEEKEEKEQEKTRQKGKQPDQQDEGLGSHILRNLSIELKNVKLIYNNQVFRESDQEAHEDLKAYFEAKMNELKVQSTMEDFTIPEGGVKDQGSSLYKTLDLKDLSVSFAPTEQESKEDRSNVIHPVTAALKVGYTYEKQKGKGIWQLEVDLKPIKIQMSRSRVRGMLALNDVLSHRSEDLKRKVEDELKKDLHLDLKKLNKDRDRAKMRYIELFAKSEKAKGEKGRLEEKEEKELDWLTLVLPLQLLASERYRCSENQHDKPPAEDKKAEPSSKWSWARAKGMANAFLFNADAGYKQTFSLEDGGAAESQTAQVSQEEDRAESFHSAEEDGAETNQEPGDLKLFEEIHNRLKDQQFKVKLQGGKVTLNVEHDTDREPFELLDLESPKFGMEVDLAMDDHGEKPSFNLLLTLGQVLARHKDKFFVKQQKQEEEEVKEEPEVNEEVKQEVDEEGKNAGEQTAEETAEDNVEVSKEKDCLELRLENRLENGENGAENNTMLKLTLEPLEIHIVPGLVRSIMDFWPKQEEVDQESRIRDNVPTAKDPEVGETNVEGEAKADDPQDTGDARVGETGRGDAQTKEVVEMFYNNLPTATNAYISLDIQLHSPIVEIPVAHTGQAIFTLGKLSLKVPPETCNRKCTWNDFVLKVDFDDTKISTENRNKERFDVVEPLPINIKVEYQEREVCQHVDVNVEVKQWSLSASPESVNLLLALPSELVKIVSEPLGPQGVKAMKRRLSRQISDLQEAMHLKPLDVQLEEKPTVKKIHRASSGLDGPMLAWVPQEVNDRVKNFTEKPMNIEVNVALKEEAIFALSDSIMPLLRLTLQVKDNPPGLRLKMTENWDLTLDEASLRMDVLNPRHGVWEPCLERFDFGLSLKMSEKTNLSVKALSPLLVNVVPTPLHQILDLASLMKETIMESSMLNDTKKSSRPAEGEASWEKLRVINLCDQELEVHCTGCWTQREELSEKMFRIKPTGSAWIPLKISVLGLKRFRVSLPGSDVSESLWFEQNASVMVPVQGEDVVAQLLTPSPNHRLLLLAPLLRLHNCTDMPLAVFFYKHSPNPRAASSVGRASQSQVPLRRRFSSFRSATRQPTETLSAPREDADLVNVAVRKTPEPVCDAALLGVVGTQWSERQQPAQSSCNDRTTTTTTAEECGLLLPPNGICAVPAEAVQIGEEGKAFTFVSLALPGACPRRSNAVALGRAALEGIHLEQGDGGDSMHFLVKPELEDVGKKGAKKVKTLSIRPTLTLMNALPFGILTLDLRSEAASSDGAASCASVASLSICAFYQLSLERLRSYGVTLGAQLDTGEMSQKADLGKDVVEDPQTRRKARPWLELRAGGGGGAALSVEALGHGQLRLSCPYWLLNRSGVKDVSVLVEGKKLPSHEDLTLLHANCFQTPCVLRGSGEGASSENLKMPSNLSNFHTFHWCRTGDALGSLALNLQSGSVSSSSVFGAKCTEFTLKPRLVLTNASEHKLLVRTSLQNVTSENRLEEGCEFPGKSDGSYISKEIHWNENPDEPGPVLRFQPETCATSGAVPCGEDFAGSWPLLLEGDTSQAWQVWSVDVAPLRGDLGVRIRPGSDFHAIHRLTNLKRKITMKVKPTDSECEFCVSSDGDGQPIGWSKPFTKGRPATSSDGVETTDGSQVFRREVNVEVQVKGQPHSLKIERMDLQHAKVQKLEGLEVFRVGTELPVPICLVVRRRGALTELSLEEDHGGAAAVDDSASFKLGVELPSVGISLIDEKMGPAPRELFFFSLEKLRWKYHEYQQDDTKKSEISISQMQAICQLPNRTDDLDRVSLLQPKRLLWKKDLPSVVLANHSGDRSFLEFHIVRHATSSRDWVISEAKLDVDSLDLTIDEEWVQPLDQWLQIACSRGMSELDLGTPALDLVKKAGKPITDSDYQVPDVPAVVDMRKLDFSDFNITVWCNLDFQRLHRLEMLRNLHRFCFVRFLSNLICRVLTLNQNLTLDGTTISLPRKTLQPHRGSLKDYHDTMLKHYTEDLTMPWLLYRTFRALGKSSIVNFARVPLKGVGATVAMVGGAVARTTDFSMSKLSHATMDKEYIQWKTRAPKSDVQGAAHGLKSAGKSLIEGFEGMFDFIQKPIMGALDPDAGGFFKGMAKGTVGTIVKPTIAVGTAVAEATGGVASSLNVANVNEASERRRQRRPLRLPRLLFGELGEVRQFSEIHAQLFQRYGDQLKGLCDVIPLQKPGDSGVIRVLLLYADKLAVALASKVVAQQRRNEAENLRYINFKALKDVSIQGHVLHLTARAMTLEEEQIDLGEAGAKAALELRLRQRLAEVSDVGHRMQDWTWDLQGEDALARERGPLHARDAARQAPSQEASAASSCFTFSGNDKPVRWLEVYEVQRFALKTSRWGPCTWISDGDLRWRWVQRNGQKHPQVKEELKTPEAAAAYQVPPCELPLYEVMKPASGEDGQPKWQDLVEINTQTTDPDGWVYGKMWGQPQWSRADNSPFDWLRRRKWNIPFQ